MRALRLVAVAVLTLLAGVSRVSAQQVRGFAATGYSFDVDGGRYPAFSGGALVDLGPWFSAGGQGETFVSWPYFGGRGAVFGQGNLVPAKPIRPFVMAGVGFGLYAGPMVGTGLEVRPPNGRLGLRLAVEDYVRSYRGFDGTKTGHQIAFRVGVLF